MLSAVIRWESSYSAMRKVSTTDTPGIPSSQSSRTRDESPQISTVVLDRDRAVLRRSEPSSRTALTGEQPDPWELLHPQDAMSRHRDSDQIGMQTLVLPRGLTIPSSSVIKLGGASLFIEVIILSGNRTENFYLSLLDNKLKSIRVVSKN